ncbi:hypothetical protein [uncultured Ramlibacter sp.]|uniref:hypothetical protein n=1 Tax=uncultured Ramlibacter sp. TaxID=260755 RepID=UPI0026023A3B|nr:hypothetical protein [uncultured Ramlibacter sp.]
MQASEFSSAAASTIEALSSAAHGAIGVCRSGGERLGELADAGWQRSFEQASPRLSPETRRNAANAHQVLSNLYRQGVQASSTGADAAVDVLARVAATAVQRAASFAASRKTA